MPWIEHQRHRYLAIACYLIAVVIGLCLPVFGGNVLSSPDETAVYVASENIASKYNASIVMPEAVDFGWLHPRSWVSQMNEIKPVGFLGYPWVLSVFSKFFDLFGVQLAALILTASFAPALYLLLIQRYSKTHSFIATIGAISVPMSVLYLNRALFPNLIQVAGVLWILLLIRKDFELNNKWNQKYLFALTGFLLTSVIAIRPFEILWILPIVIVFGKVQKERLVKERQEFLFLVVGASLALILFLILQWKTYGAPWKVGYFLRDNVSLSHADTIVTSSNDQWRFFAFGIHPRNILYNIESFLFGFAWPWVLLVVTVIGLRWKVLLGKYKPYSFALAWLACWLLLYYGNGLYQDHIRIGAVTVGNSFLRYLVPLIPVIALSMAELLVIAKQLRRQTVGYLIVGLLIILGFYRGYIGDDESVFAVIRSTKLNQQTAEMASTFVKADDLILSERSDKIFFPKHLAATPIPSIIQVKLFHERYPEKSIFLYRRPMSQKERDQWQMNGAVLSESFAFDNHVLYRITW